jgi:ATP-binding cassette subfamily B multidrug efflux pump
MSDPRPHDPALSLGGQFRKQLTLYLAGAGLLALQQLAMAQRDLFVRTAVDRALEGAGAVAARAALLMLVLSVGAAVFRVLSRVTVFTAGRNVEYELRAALLGQLHRLGPSFYRRMPTGDIMSRATNDLAQVRLLLGFGVLNVVGSLFAFASALYVMLLLSWKLTLVSLATLPVLLGVTRAFSKRMFKANREAQEAIGAMSDRVLASLSGVRVVRSFALEDAEARSFAEQNRAYLEKNLALARVRGSLGPLMGMIASVGILVVFWYGGHLVLRGELTKGGFVSFWLALLRLTWPMLAIGFVAAIFERGKAGWARLEQVFEAEPDIVGGATPVPEGPLELEVRELCFSQGSKQVLAGVSFRVAPGASVAIVGKTGSGKSTLASLLVRLLPTPKGSVLLGGVDVCELPLEALRERVGLAQQDAFLFSTTVTENVGYAIDGAIEGDSLEVVRHAAREAAVEGDIERLPDGWDTVVGERGVQLSGGQRQRVALARTLVREPSILVLDDPLSAVDAKTEAAILGAIERQAARRSVVLVTNRVAAARRCHRIVVLDEGRIVDEGTHDELSRRPGIYAEFVAEQQREEDLDALGRLELGDVLAPASARAGAPAGVAS